MPTLILPLPWQVGHAVGPWRPLPPQVGHTVSPVPGVPWGAWSPGDMGGGGEPDGEAAWIGQGEMNSMGRLLVHPGLRQAMFPATP
jgi:hypothetical protein